MRISLRPLFSVFSSRIKPRRQFTFSFHLKERTSPFLVPSAQGLDFQSTHLQKFEVEQKAFRLLPTLFLKMRNFWDSGTLHTKEVDDD